MAWKPRHEQLMRPLPRSTRPAAADAQEIAKIARAASEDPAALLREVHAFRSSLRRHQALAGASVALSPGTRGADDAHLPPAEESPFDLDVDPRPVRALRSHVPRRAIAAAAGLLIVALISGTAAAVIAHGEPAQDKKRIQALEFTAAQQYGVLALALQDHTPGQITAACTALHSSLLPLIHEAADDKHAATTALMLLQNERQLLRNAPAQSDSITTALDQSQALLTQLQNTTKKLLPPAASMTPVVLPPTPQPTTPAPTVTPGPTVPAPTPTPTVPLEPTTTPDPTPAPPTPSETAAPPLLTLLPFATTSPSS